MDQEKLLAKAQVENVDGKMIAIASDETVDRHGESIPIESWDLKNFKKNPVLLANHDYQTGSVVGVAKNIKIDGKKLTFEPVFHEITQQAREVAQMFQEGILKTFSVGFMRKWPKERDENGKPKGDVMNELLEISAVAVPANPNARIIQMSAEELKAAAPEIEGWVKGLAPEDGEPAAPAEQNTTPKVFAQTIPDDLVGMPYLIVPKGTAEAETAAKAFEVDCKDNIVRKEENEFFTTFFLKKTLPGAKATPSMPGGKQSKGRTVRDNRHNVEVRALQIAAGAINTALAQLKRK